MNGECAKYMHHYIDALEAEWTEFESKRQGLHVYRVKLPQITRPLTFAEMQHFTLTLPRRSDEHTPTIGDLYDNLEPHLRQIVQLHLESLILKCLDYHSTSRSMDQPWQIGSVYIPLLCQALEQEKARLQTGDKIGARIVIVKLAHALTAWEASMVRNFAKNADPKIVSRMEVLPDMKSMLVEILYGSIWGSE
jgi:hypothetical protein